MSTWTKVQLKNGNTVSIPLDQFLSMTDIEWEDLMNSNYGYVVNNPFSDKTSLEDIANELLKEDELDCSEDSLFE